MNPKKIIGMTLVELVLSIVIISVSITGTLLAFQTTSLFNVDPMLQQQGLTIAKSYLSEIIQKEFPTTLPCPSPPTGGRGVYSNVCDYHNLTDTGVVDQSGNAVSNLGNYTVSVSVLSSGVTLGSLTSGTDVVRVQVRVQHALMPDILMSVYKTRYA